MRQSIFNTHVPLPDDQVFLMNTFNDAQIVVSSDVVALLDRLGDTEDQETPGHTADHAHVSSEEFTDAELDVLDELRGHGFVVDTRESERAAMDKFFVEHRNNSDELHVSVLTTLQCNFACDYCLQGDHGEYNKSVTKMSPETARHVCEWFVERLDSVKPRKLVLTFFGGEPLLNLEALYAISERAYDETQKRGVESEINIITNGLLLTREIVDHLKPLGLNGVKVTLDGDRETHDRMRPLRGGQATFDKIVENIRQVADRCNIAIGGNFDEDSVDSYPALLDFLKEQSFADSLVKVAFKPIISTTPKPQTDGLIPLTAVDQSGRPLGGGCMTIAGSGGGSPCDSCHFLDEKMSFLREETKQRGFHTLDGVHMGPCEIHMTHAYTVGTDGSLFACPGFATEADQSVGHIESHLHAQEFRTDSAERFDALSPWQHCGDCSFIPVCGGGCSVASHNEQGDMNLPSCHKSSFETAVVSMAYEAAGVSEGI